MKSREKKKRQSRIFFPKSQEHDRKHGESILVSESDNLFGKSVHYIRFNASLLDKILSTKVKSTRINRYIDVTVNDEFLRPLRVVGEGFGYENTEII